MKKLFGFLFLFVCLFALVACGSKDNSGTNPSGDGTGEKDPDPQPQTDVDSDVSDAFKGIASGKKIYLTTCGQSDVDIVEIILSGLIEENEDAMKANFDGKSTYEEIVTRKDSLKAEEVEDGSVVFVVVGGSNKGLGTAGTDVSKETQRAADFASAKGRITLIVLHVGKQARRGDTSDPIIRAVAPSAKLLMVVNDGDFDGYFAGVAKANSIEYHQYSKNPKLAPSFLKMLCK